MWLHVPLAFCPSSPVAAHLISPSDSLCQMLEQSATWRGNFLPAASWRRVLRKDLSTTPLFGLTSEPSTLARGVEAWIASLADSPVRTSPSPVAVRELSKETEAGFGSNLPVSFARFDPGSSSWKTSAQSLFEDSTLFSETWPRSGMMRNGCVFERRTWAPAIGESAGSVSQWPTARSEDTESCGNHLGAVDSLTGASAQWATPQAHDQSGGNPNRVGKFGTEHGGRNLADDVTLWSTPNVPNGGRTLSDEDILNRGQTAKGKRQVGLENEARIWRIDVDYQKPLPDEDSNAYWQRMMDYEKEHGITPEMLSGGTQWPTPASRDWKSGDASEMTMERNERPLNEIAERFHSSPQAPATHDGPQSSPSIRTSRRRLNPAFAAWLMGLPFWWTHPEPIASGRLETASWLSRARQVLENF